MKRALALVLLLGLTRCGALDESAPTRPTPHACKTVDEDLKPVLDLVAAGQLNHLATLLPLDKARNAERVLFIVDRIELAKQTLEDFNVILAEYKPVLVFF